MFRRAGDFDPLAAPLAGIKGKVLLPINDTPGVRAMFASFHSTVADTSTVGARAAVLSLSSRTLSPDAGAGRRFRRPALSHLEEEQS